MAYAKKTIPWTKNAARVASESAWTKRSVLRTLWISCSVMVWVTDPYLG